MKLSKGYFLICVLFFLGGIAQAQLTSTNLPIILITTPGAVTTTAQQGSMSIIDNTSGVNTPTSTPAFVGMIGIKLRGNATTQSYPKLSYSIETWNGFNVSLDTSLLGLPTENDWVLLASYPDRSLMRTVLSFNLHEDMGRYAPRMRFCEVILNNQYVGIYTFGEKVKRDANRVNLSKLTTLDNSGVNLTGGYIWKVDDEIVAGWTSQIMPPYASTQTYSFNYEYPDASTITPVQKAYSKSYIDSFENAMNGSNFQDTTLGWRNFASQTSFIDFMIMQEVSRNEEAYRVNTFLYKDKSKKLKIGPLWNGELAWKNTATCQGSSDTGWCYNFGATCGTMAKLPPFWWKKLITDTMFILDLKCTYTTYRASGNILDTVSIFHTIDSMSTYLNAQNAVTRNFTQWPIWGVPIVNEPTPMAATYAQEILNLKIFIKKRLQWLDLKWNSSLCNPSGISNVNLNSSIELFPNPTQDKVTIHVSSTGSESFTVSLRNLEGSLLSKQDAKNNTCILNLESYAKGIYLITINSKDGSITKKLVKN